MRSSFLLVRTEQKLKKAKQTKTKKKQQQQNNKQSKRICILVRCNDNFSAQ